MNLNTGTIRASPYVGIFAATSDEVTILPESTLPKEEEKVRELLQTRIVTCSLAASSVVGCLCRGNKQGFVFPSIVEDKELEQLREKKVNVLRTQTNLCLGNWIALNDSVLVHHKRFPQKVVDEIAEFLKVKAISVNWEFTELVGASLVLTNNGFVVDPRIPEKAFLELEKAIGIKGKWSTANYGDLHIGNSLLANTKGALVGSNSTNVEIVSIDDGLSMGGV